jgi:periplasmic protein TonB
MSLNKSQALSIAKQYMLQRNVRAAIDIYREIIEADPTDLTAINTLGDLYASTGMVQEATAQFSRVADGYIESGLTRKAIATLKKIIAADPANTRTAIKLADMYAQAGLPSEARQHYLRIVGVYTSKGETLEALRIFSKLVDLDPSNPSTRIKLGELYLSEGMNDQAYEAFVTAAEQLTNEGETRRALNAYKEALSLKPDSVGTLAVVNNLAMKLGVDQDKVRRGSASQSAASDYLADEASSPLTASDLPPAPTPIHSEGSDDFLVVQEISKAERLVAYGGVNQAISMLKDVLTNKPDNIDVHIKLKDICLRTGMMAEAAHECGELARIHQARGEHDRARDYAVRANRLIQLIERPSGDLQQPERKPVQDAKPRADAALIRLAPPPEPEPIPRQATSQLDADRPQPARITLSVVPPAAITAEAATTITTEADTTITEAATTITEAATTIATEADTTIATEADTTITETATTITTEADTMITETATTITTEAATTITTEAATIAADLPQPLHSDYVEPPPSVSEAIFQAELSLESLLDQAVSSSTNALAGESELDQAVSSSTNALAGESELDQATSSSTDAPPGVLPVLSFGMLPVEKKRVRLTAAALAATVLAFGLVGSVIGGFAYNADLDKQYEALTREVPPFIEPSSPPAPVSESEAIQESEPIMVDVTPSLQPETPPRVERPEPEVIKDKQPAPSQPASEPIKVMSRPSTLPPRIAVNPDSQAFTENRTPAGLAGDVPVTATHPAEPPPKAVRRSAGIVSGVAVKKVDPVYPKAAREAQQTGVVAVEITIDELGNVTSARALSGPDLLRNAAVSAARGWKFKPSLLGGVPVTTTSTITFNFKL